MKQSTKWVSQIVLVVATFHTANFLTIVRKKNRSLSHNRKIVLVQARFHTPDYLTIVKKMNQRGKIILVNILLTLNPFPNNKIITDLSSK